MTIFADTNTSLFWERGRAFSAGPVTAAWRALGET